MSQRRRGHPLLHLAPVRVRGDDVRPMAPEPHVRRAVYPRGGGGGIGAVHGEGPVVFGVLHLPHGLGLRRAGRAVLQEDITLPIVDGHVADRAVVLLERAAARRVGSGRVRGGRVRGGRVRVVG
eukprot:3900809-Prymnesium_polylepis.1